MAKNHDTGFAGEKEIVKKVPCPNCGRKLMLLPKSYPLVDVQCTGCFFRAQVKTNNHAPADAVFGATWDIMEKNLKSGHLVPPLIVNFKWLQKGKKRQEIVIYPFLKPSVNIRKRYTEISKTGRKLWMYNYVGLRNLAKIILFAR